MAFDPDEYLKSKDTGFDPDAYLAGFDPDKYLQGHQNDELTGQLKKIGGGLETAAGLVAPLPATIVGGLRGAGAVLSGQGIDEANRQLQETIKSNFGLGEYKPYSEKGKEYSQKTGEVLEKPIHWAGDVGEKLGGNEGRYIGELTMGTAMNFIDPALPVVAGVGAGKVGMGAIRKGKELIRKPEISGPDFKGLTEELVQKPKETGMIPNLKATEGPDGQMALFDIPEEGRMPNPYEAVTGDWRIDENGIPIKADLSMDAANAAEPLQRNLWGDELAQKHPQENARSIPEAIDSIPDTPFKGDARDIAINRLKGTIDAPGELLGAKLEAETPFTVPKGQRGAINAAVFDPMFEKIKEIADGIKLIAKGQGESLKIEAIDRNGERIGGALYEPTNKYDAPTQTDLSATMIGSKKRGTATQIYKFASELGNDIVPSKKLTAGGAGTWAKMEREGISKGMRVPRGQRGGIRVDYSKRNEAKVLKGIPGLREKIGDIMPDTRTTEQFLKDEVKASDVNQNFLQKSINYLTKGGIYQTIKTQNPLVKRVTERFLEADNSAKAQIADMVHDRLAPAARELSDTEKADVWAAQQIAEKAGKPLDAETMRKYGFNEKQVKWVEAHIEVMKTMYGKLSEAMKASGIKPVSPQVAYVASRATGDFRTLVHDTEGNVVGILGANTRAGLKRDIERLKAQNPDYVIGEERYFGKGSKKGGTAESFSQMLEFLSENDPKMKDFVKRVNDMLTEDAFNYMNAKSHTMYKKGVFGMEGRKPFADAVENARDGMQAQIQYAEKMIKWAEMSKAVEDIKPVLAKDNGLNMPNAKAWAEDYVQQALGNNPTETGRAIDAAFATLGKATGIGTTLPSRAVSAAKRVTNGLLLGFVNIGFLAANMLQPFKANPEMMAFLKGRGLEKGFDAGTGYTYFAKALDTMWKDEAGKALPEYKQGALDYAKKNHVYSSDLFEASNTANKGVGYYWDKATQFVAASVESVTRQMTFLSYVELLHENGLKKADGLYETAQRLTDMHMNNYSQIEAPKAYMAAGGVGKTAYNLMSYKHNELSRLAMLTSELGRSKTATPLLTHIAASVAFAGVMGTILYSEADWFVKQISKLTGKPTSLTKILLDNPQISDTFKYGFGSLGGVDLTNRLGLGPLTPGSGHAVDAIMPGASKIVNIAKTGTEAIKNHDEYSFKNFAREMLPNSVASIADRAWFSPKNAKGEEMSLNRNKVQVNATRNAADKLWKSIGMTGINEAKQKALDYENQQITKAYEDKRKDIVMNAAKAFFTSGKLPPDFGKAYIEAQGDPNSLEREATQIAMEQKVPMHTLQLIKNAMSQSITSTHKALRATGRE